MMSMRGEKKSGVLYVGLGAEREGAFQVLGRQRSLLFEGVGKGCVSIAFREKTGDGVRRAA